MSENITDIVERAGESSGRKLQVGLIAEYLLAEEYALTCDTALSSSKIYDLYLRFQKSERTKFPEITPDCFSVSLSNYAKEPDTNISCLGTRKGYFFKSPVGSLKDKPSFSVFREKDLYPVLARHLKSQDYDAVADISQRKRAGQWVNPDLLGIQVSSTLGSFQCRFTTFEVKPGWETWRKDIFEAVSHSVFSDRSYFAFLCPSQFIGSPVEQVLLRVAMHKNIGLIYMVVEDDLYARISEKKDSFNGDCKVVEKYTPSYKEPVDICYQEFLESLGFRVKKDVSDFCLSTKS